MKKENVAKILTVSMVGIMMTGGGVSVAAADGGAMDSHGYVTFEQNTDPATPINPTDPTEPVGPKDPADPTDPHEPGTAGPLSIDYVSNFHFGTQKASGKDQVYTASLDKVYKKTDGSEVQVPNFVQVTDNRGSNAGWHLTVKQNGQFKTSGSQELDGAQITLKNSHLNGTDMTDSSIQPTTASGDIVLDPSGAASDVMNAEVNKGMGTWLTSFGDDTTTGAKSVELFVPGKAKKEASDYSTTLTWTLTDTPA
ncbi:WxL domain-containing protein [Listeria ilorinensis]|uniref:WxL domain-containing protein n=1 Tax=Listeria ilorinensis TaxID=2867439 RepID=UPI001EF3ED5D|nr:WxL domain-containing protein [Listeria ilorinensis]